MQQELSKLCLPELTYSYTALEPYLISDILEIHHKKHHNGYVNKYNKLVDDLLPAIYKKDISKVQTLLPKVHFVSGGHNCHKMYWENLAPADNGGGVLPDDKSLFKKALVKEWGSIDNFIKDFNGKTGAI